MNSSYLSELSSSNRDSLLESKSSDIWASSNYSISALGFLGIEFFYDEVIELPELMLLCLSCLLINDSDKAYLWEALDAYTDPAMLSVFFLYNRSPPC